MIRAAGSTGGVRTTVTVTQKDSRKTKDENERDAEVFSRESPVASPVSADPSKALGSVTWAQGFTLSQKFQTVKVECSVHLPILVTVNSRNPKVSEAEVHEGLARAKEMAEDAITASLGDQRASLQSLIDLVGR
jgi:hypothetical protein